MTIDPMEDRQPQETLNYLHNVRIRERKQKSQNRKAHRRRVKVQEAYLARTEGRNGEPDSGGPGSEFETTYRPGRLEKGWLLESLAGFYEEGLITDVLAQVKGGKEANVYVCQAHPDLGCELLAAKVYRPRKFRNLSNDALYRQGREILSNEGGIVRRNDSRAMRAMKGKTKLGVRLLHQSWIRYEYGTLERLHRLGVRVPKPVSCGDNAVLMEFIGDENGAAPVLQSVRLTPEERQPLFEVTLESIELMLQEGLIHGDLSPFNILYREGELTLIDFPQVSMAQTNPRGQEIFRRDVLRVCEYFRKQGVDCDPVKIANTLWREYLGEEMRLVIEDDVE